MTPPREQSYESFDNFVIQHGPMLLRVARRHASAYRLPNSAAEDICQEALLRAWTRWGSIERGRAFGWVCVTEYYVAAEMSRDHERFSREKTEMDFNQRPGNDPEP
jgi:DNA-directed RNA polymerase specialized sigma24 family protein